MEIVLQKIQDIIREGGNIVVLGGEGVMLEAGLNGVNSEHIAYEVEEKYGYAAEEMVSALFYARRLELFYRYYKEVILANPDPTPSPIHQEVAKLQRYGKLDAVVTRMVYSLYQKAGCQNVIEIHGSVEANRCPICGKHFDARYVKNAIDIPRCDICNLPLRPGFTLLGEMLDNSKITQASNAVETARILLILGASINSPLCRYMVKYYRGKQMILLNDKEAPGDEIANYRAYGNISEMFTKIMNF